MVTIDSTEINKVRSERQCSVQQARHVLVREKLEKILSTPCSNADLRGMLKTIISRGNITFR